MFSKNKDHDFASLEAELKQDMQFSIMEGVFSTLMGSMIGGAILTGFALSLGADSFVIGLLASLPLLANMVQIIASYLIDKVGDSKKVCLSYVLLHRFLWFLIILSPFLLLRAELYDLRIWIFVALLGIGSIFASISGLSWNSWMADLIPANIRGRFFAKRNMASQLVGMVAVVAAGIFIDYWRRLSPDAVTESYGFVYLFALGTIAGFVSVFLLRKINKSRKTSKKDEKFLQKLKLPLRDSNFKKFIIFTSVWGFAVTLVSPNWSNRSTCSYLWRYFSKSI
ncbi:MAG: MFS transporter [bacterium]